jgi:hypothetical protein
VDVYETRFAPLRVVLESAATLDLVMCTSPHRARVTVCFSHSGHLVRAHTDGRGGGGRCVQAQAAALVAPVVETLRELFEAIPGAERHISLANYVGTTSVSL